MVRRYKTLVLSITFAGLACDAPPEPKEPKAPESSARKPKQQRATPEPEAPPQAEPTPAERVAIEIETADGGVVHADRYALRDGDDRPVVLLFHQAGWNAGEYEPIAPRLQKLGFHALATDQRSGGTRDDRDNRTVAARGKSTGYAEAYADLEAALAWAKKEHRGPVIVWGSSYSAALVFKLASEHAEEVLAVLAFSPGEYIAEKGSVAGWAKGVKQPVFVTSAPGKEVGAAKAILAASPSETKVQHEPKKGVHGSSILRTDKNAGGTDPAWAAVESFLLAL